MKRRISPRTRERAAVVCAQVATWWTGDYDPAPPFGSKRVEELIDAVSHAARTAEPPPRSASEYQALWWAEMEALLRTGWSPS